MTIGANGAARTTRPAAQERRRELAEAAAVHFHGLGFHRVALADIAASVGVTAPAVYRHFRNKNALLAGAIDTGLDHVEAALEQTASLDDALPRLAEAALRRRDVWVLLQREIRHLDPTDRERATGRFRLLAGRFADLVRAARPDLVDGQAQVLTTGVFAALASPAVHPLDLPHDAYRRLLTAASTAACAAPLPTAVPRSARRRRSQTPGTRGGQVLDTAIGLFHRHGYAAVSVDDIGEAVGIAGPSIYHHFPTKSDLLLAAYDRAFALLPAPDPLAGHPVLDLLARYAVIVLGERELFGVYVTETINLPPDATARIDAAVSADDDRWIAVLRRERPELSPVEATLLVHAARAVVHDAARLGRLHTRAAIVSEIVGVAGAVLCCDPGT